MDIATVTSAAIDIFLREIRTGYEQLIQGSVDPKSLGHNHSGSASWRITCVRALEEVMSDEGKEAQPGQTGMLALSIYDILWRKDIKSIDVTTLRKVVRAVFS